MPTAENLLPWIYVAASLALLFMRFAMRLPGPLRAPPVFLLGLFFGLRAADSFMAGLPDGTVAAPWVRMAASTVLAWGIARLALFSAVELPHHVRGKEPLPRITRDFILLISYAILLFLVMRTHGQGNLTGLITTSAVLTAVIGLASQATLSSLLSGIVLQMERPFSVGDWIRYQDHIGKVIGISWKATRLQTRNLTEVYIPNEQLTGSSFENLSKPEKPYIASMEIGLDYTIPPYQARDVLLSAMGREPPIQPEPAPEVRLLSYGDSAIVYQLRFAMADGGAENRVKSDINYRIWYHLKRAGMSIPFPIRTVHFAHVERRREEALKASRQSDRLNMLRAIPILKPLSADVLHALARGAHARLFGAGEIVVRQGDPGQSMFVVYRGDCEVLREKPGTAPQRLAAIGAGGFFGEMSLLTGDPRTATVKAIGEAELMEIDKSTFAAVLAGDPSISATLAEALAQRQQALAASGLAAEATVTSKSIVSRIRSFFGI